MKVAIKWMVFVVIFALAVALRISTFSLPHYRGDQHHYVALAFKLDTEGIAGYNLRGVDMYSPQKYPELVIFAKAADKGVILKSLELGGITYYDEPLHHMPFGFPAALMLSHKIFSAGTPYSTLTVPNDTEVIGSSPPGVGLRNYRFSPAVRRTQFYAVTVPFFFSLALIVAVYLIARTLYADEWVALAAMFLMAISPIDILSSQKIWADDMAAFFAAAAALLYLLSLSKKMPLLALAGGLACGVAAVTKQNSGAIIALTIITWHIVSNKALFDKNFSLFSLGCFLASVYWFAKVTAVYGDPIYRPHQAGLVENAKTAWFRIVNGRPKHLYLLGIPYQNPLFALAYLSPIWLWLDKELCKKHLFPVIWLASAFLLSYKFFTGEHRYMLTAYPAFAILASYTVNRLRTFMDKKTGYRSGTILLIALLAGSFFWSVPMALETLFYNGALIMKPF